MPHHPLKPRCPNCGERLVQVYSEKAVRFRIKRHLAAKHGLTELQAEEFAARWTPRKGVWKQTLSDAELAEAVAQKEADDRLEMPEDPRIADFDLDAYNASRF